MALATYGIYVLTTRFEESINGMIASWVSQVSYEPPMFMAAIHPNRYTHELVAKSGHFALHIISREQKGFLDRFKGRAGKEKFESIAWKDGVTGCPILADCIGCMECRVIQSLTPGNHTMFIGKVVNAIFNEEKTPLCTLDYEGSYLGKA
ncbi:MAG: flavin reductase [Deltaproteobacteria bacterium]|nr:flavin reductase [Deltaproteobacteria bacterium]